MVDRKLFEKSKYSKITKYVSEKIKVPEEDIIDYLVNNGDAGVDTLQDIIDYIDEVNINYLSDEQLEIFTNKRKLPPLKRTKEYRVTRDIIPILPKSSNRLTYVTFLLVIIFYTFGSAIASFMYINRINGVSFALLLFSIIYMVCFYFIMRFEIRTEIKSPDVNVNGSAL